MEIKHIILPPSPTAYRDIFVIFELLETDLHQVIKANDDLTPEHHQFFLYQMLRGLKYIHSGTTRRTRCVCAPEPLSNASVECFSMVFVSDVCLHTAMPLCTTLITPALTTVLPDAAID